MSLVQRAINILTQPRVEWARIDAEPATVGGLYGGYAAILAVLPAIGTVLGGLLFASMLGPFAGAFGLTFVITMAIVGYVVSLAVLFVMGIVANALAPSFGGVKSDISAHKLVVYCATATWVAGFFSFIPALGVLISLAGFAYAAYLLYLGSTAVMKVPADKAAGYTAVTIIIWIVIYFVLAAIIGGIMTATMFSSAIATGAMYR